MTEIPEHLMKRAREARAKAAGQPVPEHLQSAPAQIPAHLLERAKAARESQSRYQQAQEGFAEIMRDKPKTRKIPHAGTTPAEYNLMIADIRRAFQADRNKEIEEITLTESAVYTIQNPGTWAVITGLACLAFLVWAFFWA